MNTTPIHWDSDKNEYVASIISFDKDGNRLEQSATCSAYRIPTNETFNTLRLNAELAPKLVANLFWPPGYKPKQPKLNLSQRLKAIVS